MRSKHIQWLLSFFFSYLDSRDFVFVFLFFVFVLGFWFLVFGFVLLIFFLKGFCLYLRLYIYIICIYNIFKILINRRPMAGYPSSPSSTWVLKIVPDPSPESDNSSSNPWGPTRWIFLISLQIIEWNLYRFVSSRR